MAPSTIAFSSTVNAAEPEDFVNCAHEWEYSTGHDTEVIMESV